MRLSAQHVGVGIRSWASVVRTHVRTGMRLGMSVFEYCYCFLVIIFSKCALEICFKLGPWFESTEYSYFMAKILTMLMLMMYDSRDTTTVPFTSDCTSS